MGSIADIRKVVARVRWRLRLQSALKYGLLFGALGLFVFAGLIVLVKARVLETDMTQLAAGIAIALPCVGVVLGLLRRLDDIRLAAALDSTGGLHSRLGSALAYARLETRTPMQDAAISDAISAVDRASPKLAAPWQWRAVAVGGVAAVAATALTVPAVWALDLRVSGTDGAALGRLPTLPGVIARTQVELRKDDVTKLEKVADEIKAIEEEAKDETVREFVADLNELVRQLQEGKITPEEAHARLAALEKALSEWKQQNLADADKVESQLKSAAEQKKDAHEALKPLLDAMKQDNLEEAAKELEKLAEKFEKKELTEKDTKKISKDLKDLAQKLMSERQKDEDRLKKEKDRLSEKAKKEKDRLSEKDKERLKDLQRQLEKLAQDEKALSEAMRQLEKLGRNFDQAAEDLMRRLAEEIEAQGGMGDQGQNGGQGDKGQGENGEKGQNGEQQGAEDENRREQPGQQAGQEGQQGRQGPEGQQGQQGQGGQGDLSAEDIRRAAQAIRKMGQSGQGRQQMRAAEGRMTDVREMMRRAAEGRLGQNGQGGQGGQKAGQSGQQGQQGQGGQNGQGQSAWQRFQEGAQGEGQQGDPTQAGAGQEGAGQPGEKVAGLMPGEPGQSDQGEMLLLGGNNPGGKAEGGQRGMPGRGNHAGSDARLGGEGIGEGHDKNLLGGPRTSMDGVKTTDDFVGGKQNDGASRSSVVYGAAQKGFAGVDYAQVHQDYSSVVEDTLEQEHIPAGKRTYVRKYFDLIRPR